MIQQIAINKLCRATFSRQQSMMSCYRQQIASMILCSLQQISIKLCVIFNRQQTMMYHVQVRQQSMMSCYLQQITIKYLSSADNNQVGLCSDIFSMITINMRSVFSAVDNNQICNTILQKIVKHSTVISSVDNHLHHQITIKFAFFVFSR